MREGKKKMSLKPVFAGILGTQEGSNEDKPFCGSSTLSTRVMEERLSA